MGSESNQKKMIISSLMMISCEGSSDSITGGESVEPPPEWPEE